MTISSIANTGHGAILDGQKDLAGRRQAREALGTALASGDLEAARAAFDQFSATTSAERSTRHPDGPFAKLQAALAAGDVAGATAAWQKLPGTRQHPGDEGERTSQRLATEGTLGRHVDLSA